MLPVGLPGNCHPHRTGVKFVTMHAASPACFWHAIPDGRIQCDLCPRLCKLRDGQRGFCFVRVRHGDALQLETYGRNSGLLVDPIEKKPLNHFLPGSKVLSFGTSGCNLGCAFCQNWHISKSREAEASSIEATPDQIARRAAELGCLSVAFTYNDPVIFHEYAVDVARACRDLGVKSVAVTAGWVNPEPRAEFYRHMDAVNIDLKAFTDDFYRRICGGNLSHVLETLEYVRHETDVWLEVTTLLVPGLNDSPDEIDELTRWVAGHLGPETPLHFTAFHPDWRILDVPPTPPETLMTARQIGLENGLHYVYTGNIRDPAGNTTRCHECGAVLIGRDGYMVTDWRLQPGGLCSRCDTRCPGVF